MMDRNTLAALEALGIHEAVNSVSSTSPWK